ncbi:hypothetical protein FE392_07445 [Xenorhabdus sp. 12]|uniref:Uncharacterized protein n=2 Tax=Xenorhabdus santafensis TaxID=2582833 RepID=A0ABU4S8R8_9GAMM|nr:hypothetical protein [Xenorhabdus sp. 12]
MVIIQSHENGDISVAVDGYQATYDRNGKLKESICRSKYAPEILFIPAPSKQKVEQKQAGITAESFKTFDIKAEVTYVNSSLNIDPAKISEAKIKASDDHIRQLIRKELQRFVNRERRLGGLFSKW